MECLRLPWKLHLVRVYDLELLLRILVLLNFHYLKISNRDSRSFLITSLSVYLTNFCAYFH